ncbi:glycosyltransferase family 2 protein [Bauldia litoralis]|uniref:glycosyltransferase family 2 protein n=1 Tax=Bauldia litoralis TaxID=665467 RepID=UPI003267D480
MADSPRYSIITTCKGRWHHLSESLPQLLAQPDSEVIVVDYACPDRTAERVAESHPAARVVRVRGVEGFNASRARNCGATEALGETLIFVDADVIISDRFVALVDATLGEGAYAKPHEPEVVLDNSYQGTCVVHRRHFDLVGGYDEVLTNYGGEDLELYERLAVARVESVFLDPAAFVRVIDHDHQDRGRYFDMSAERGFLIGKVYRVAKDAMVRLNGQFDIDPDLRQQLYDEVARLVGNMERMERKELSLEIKFPDDKTRGLHETWEFLRTVTVQVKLR